MTTMRTVVTRSLRLLRIVAAEEVPTATQAADGLETLNEMLHSLKARSADIDYQDLTLDDDLPLPPEHVRPVRYALAAELAPEYGTEMTPEVAVEADGAIRTLQAAYGRVPRLRPDRGIKNRLHEYAYNIDRDT